MFDLANFTLRDMTELGSVLRKFDRGAQSMEEVANRVVRYLYEHLGDAGTGARSCALVRFFKTHAYAELESELRDFARGMLHDHTPAPGMKCLTLLATAGERPEWNSREASVGHKTIPLASEELVSKFPMISNLVQQLGIKVEALLKPTPGLLVESEPSSFNVFHVLEARRSAYIPDQADFVEPFEIESVLGLGGMLPRRDIFAVILFSKVHIPRETAELFRTLALNVEMAVLPFDETVFARAQGAGA
jgi:hypothetical protein